MTVHAWRIVQSPYARNAFSGEGAKRAGGRWNSPGTRVVYLAATQSLAILEMLVHLHSADLLRRYVLLSVRFDESLFTSLDTARLPRNWKRLPAPTATQRLDDDWVASNTSLLLRVPSVIIPTEYNYLLNPAHPDFPQLRIAPRRSLPLDPRLFKN